MRRRFSARHMEESSRPLHVAQVIALMPNEFAGPRYIQFYIDWSKMTRDLKILLGTLATFPATHHQNLDSLIILSLLDPTIFARVPFFSDIRYALQVRGRELGFRVTISEARGEVNVHWPSAMVPWKAKHVVVERTWLFHLSAQSCMYVDK